MLSRTPAPRATESLLGYALRISETNGYDTPWHILSYAGFEQGEMLTAGFPVEKLGPILGRDASTLRHIAYCATEPEGRYFKILDHRLGASMKDGWLGLAKPAFCPACVKEEGHIDAFWDLSQGVACPKHGCQLLTTCPGCDRRLTWFRPGLLECRCGADLATAPLPPADPAVVQMMAVLRAKLHRDSIPSAPNSAGLPLAELESLSLKAFLVMLNRIAVFATSSQGEAKLVPYHAVEQVAHALSDWPSGYHAFLDRLGATLRRDRPSAVGLRKQFTPFYEAMFKANPLAGEVAFLRTEFIKFGQATWGHAIVDRKLLRDDFKPDSRFVSQNETARDIGVRPITLQRWVGKGLVAAKEVTIGSQRRYIFDKARLPLAAALEGRVLETRAAAAQVNLPVSVLLGLKDSGHYVAESMPRHKRGFHERDLEALRRRIIDRAPPMAEIPTDVPLVSLDHVLQNVHFWSKAGKTSFVTAYLDGAVNALGRSGESWSDILFHSADVDALASRSRLAQSSSAVSQQEAALQLGCGIDVVGGLLTHGFLEGHPGPNRIRVRTTSLCRFQADYVGLAALAKRGSTSARRLDRLCEIRGIERIEVRRRGGSVAKFIRVTEQQRLLDNLVLSS